MYLIPGESMAQHGVIEVELGAGGGTGRGRECFEVWVELFVGNSHECVCQCTKLLLI